MVEGSTSPPHRAALLLPPAGVHVLRRARRLAGPRRGRRCDRARAARGEREPRRGLRDQPPGQGDPRAGRSQGGAVPRVRAARGDLRPEHDLAELHAVADRGREFAARRRDPGLLARPRRRRRAVARARARPASWSSATSSSLDDTTLDYDDLARKLGPRTRVVAFAWASNAVGTVVDAQRVCELAHDAGALAWIDAVHYAAHEPIDVRQIGADVLICSPYKFCGPHIGDGLRARRGDRAVAAVQGPAGADHAAGPAVRDRDAAVRAARRLQRHARLPATRSAGSRRSCPTSARSASGSSPGSPTRCRLRPAGDGGPGADVPDQRRRVSALRRSPRASPSRTWASGPTTRGTR